MTTAPRSHRDRPQYALLLRSNSRSQTSHTDRPSAATSNRPSPSTHRKTFPPGDAMKPRCGAGHRSASPLTESNSRTARLRYYSSSAAPAIGDVDAKGSNVRVARRSSVRGRQWPLTRSADRLPGSHKPCSSHVPVEIQGNSVVSAFLTLTQRVRTNGVLSD